MKNSVGLLDGNHSLELPMILFCPRKGLFSYLDAETFFQRSW